MGNGDHFLVSAVDLRACGLGGGCPRGIPIRHALVILCKVVAGRVGTVLARMILPISVCIISLVFLQEA